MIVVDLGCFAYEAEYNSIDSLIEHFHPSELYGFDANPAQVTVEEVRGETRVHLKRAAAGTEEGMKYWWFYGGGPGSYVNDEHGGHPVPTFDLAAFVQELRTRHPDDPIVLKLDVEGAEVPLLRHLIDTNTDLLLEKVLVEYHGAGQELSGELRCPAEAWWM